MQTRITGADLVAAVRDLFPILDAAWAESDEGRRVPTRVVEEMRRAGLFRLVVPSELGGAEADLRTFLEVLEQTAYGHGAAGWDVATSAMGSLYLNGLPRQGLEEIYGGGPDVIVAGTVTLDRDTAKAEATAEGYRVTGRWRFGSGCQDADWMIATAEAFEHGMARRDADGELEWRYFSVPRASAQILDTWRVLGMRGTGSHDWAVQDCLIPAKRTETAAVVQRMIVPRPWRGTLYRFPLQVIGSLHFGAVATGLARRAIDSLVELAAVKTPHRAPGLLRERVQVQEAVARAEATLESARAFRDRMVDEAWRTVDGGEPLTRRQRALVRLAGTHACEAATRAVDLMYAAGGTTSIEEDSALSRCFRDVHVVAQSVTVVPLHYETVGRVLLDLEPGGLMPL
jgi:alkylation response protein AidB-like acyl-CoA dehydrogenase